MARRGRSWVLDPAVGDRYTLVDGSEWVVLAAGGGVVALEAVKSSVVRVWETSLSRLLVQVACHRRSGC